MTRLTHCPPRVQPPLRGRAAAFADPERLQSMPQPVFRRHPPGGGAIRERVVYRTPDHPVHPGLIELYQLWPYLFKLLDRPWKWLAALAAIIILSVLIGSLL
ncbi:hypothetical protein [Nodosilinea nodulosa]|uniref:hypothetical protein n=1 Tax=Nodosilinea nodulosa TaxID=416001 RepID=UPI0002D3A2B3|nr:hypothetical protein [Nodosilinea nodulosa]